MPTIKRPLPSQGSDNSIVDYRANRYGEIYVNPVFDGVMAAADEGSYFTAVNPTSGTGIGTSIATAYSGTASAIIAIRNTDSNTDAANGKRIYLDYIKLICTVAPASGTAAHFDIDIDNVLTRFTSGGTALTIANPNMQANSTSVALVNAGALTTVALSSAGRTISRIRVRTVIPVVGDTYIITFGGVDKPSGAGVINGTNPQIITYNAPPVVLGQNHVMCLSGWYPSNASTAASYEVEMGWIEK